MKNERIIEIALECGFKERPQPDGSLGLNPYVFEFARRIANECEAAEFTKLALMDMAGGTLTERQLAVRSAFEKFNTEPTFEQLTHIIESL